MNLLLPLVILAASLLLAIFPPGRNLESRYLLVPVFASIAGGVLVFAAKLPRLGTGHWVSFGFKGCLSGHALPIVSGMCLLLGGALSALAVATH